MSPNPPPLPQQLNNAGGKYDKINNAIQGYNSNKKTDNQPGGGAVVHINVSSELTSPKHINALGVNPQAAVLQYKNG